jgi:SH3-like domain-containing protein
LPLAVFVLALLPSCFAAAADNPPAAGKPSAPYFVSMKNDTTNMREGPSADTRIKWVYHRKGLPVEVVATFDAWRRVRDIDGEIGWIHMALLSRERTAVVKGNGDVEVHSSADAGSKTVAQAEPGAIGILRGCGTAACRGPLQWRGGLGRAGPPLGRAGRRTVLTPRTAAWLSRLFSSS